MHDHLTFRWAPGDVDSTDADSVVQLFAQGLRDRGAEEVTITPHHRSWKIPLRVGKHRFDVLLGILDGQLEEWLVVIIPRLSRLRRLFGADDTPHQIGLLRWVEEIAFGSDHCVDQTWYTKEAWHDAYAKRS